MRFLPFGKKSIEQFIKEGVKNEAEFKQLISEACQKGAVHAKFFIDAHGGDKKATEDVLIDVVARITKEKGVLYCKGEIEQSIEKDGLHSSFAHVEIITANFQYLAKIFLTYAPASVEILEPSKLYVPVKEAQDILLEISQNTQMYSRYITEHSMTQEQKQNFAERLKRKAEYGAKLREKAIEKKNSL